MKTRVRKWGNSLAIRLPKALVETHSILDGTGIELAEHEDGILLKPVSKGYELGELLNGIKPGNRHEMIETGEPTGKEAW